MNFLLVALVAAVLVGGAINTEPKDSEGSEKTQVVVNKSSEIKPAQKEVKEEVKSECNLTSA